MKSRCTWPVLNPLLRSQRGTLKPGMRGGEIISSQARHLPHATCVICPRISGKRLSVSADNSGVETGLGGRGGQIEGKLLSASWRALHSDFLRGFLWRGSRPSCATIGRETAQKWEEWKAEIPRGTLRGRLCARERETDNKDFAGVASTPELRRRSRGRGSREHAQWSALPCVRQRKASASSSLRLSLFRPLKVPPSPGPVRSAAALPQPLDRARNQPAKPFYLFWVRRRLRRCLLVPFLSWGVKAKAFRSEFPLPTRVLRSPLRPGNEASPASHCTYLIGTVLSNSEGHKGLLVTRASVVRGLHWAGGRSTFLLYRGLFNKSFLLYPFPCLCCFNFQPEQAFWRTQKFTHWDVRWT